MLRIDLGETENLRVGKRTAIFFFYFVQILYLFRTQSQAFLLIVFLNVLHMLDWFRLVVDREDRLIQPLVHALQHAVVGCIFAFHWKVLLYTRNAGETHVLRDLNGISAPGGYHLSAWSYKETIKLLCFQQRGVTVKPAKSLLFLVTGLMVYLSGNNILLGSLEEKNHNL